MKILRLASTGLSLVLLLSPAALAKPGHEPFLDRDVTVGALSRDAGPGDPWSAVITVRTQDGRVTGVNPVLALTDQAGGRYFAVGRRTDEPGTYRARLPAPPAGVYRVTVDDGLGVEHAAGTTRVVDRGAASPGGDSGMPGWPLPLGAGGAAVCLLLLMAALRHRRGSSPSASAA